MTEYFVINWDTSEAIEGPFSSRSKATRIAKKQGHLGDANKNATGGRSHSPVAFVGVKTGYTELWRKWAVEYNPRFKAK